MTTEQHEAIMKFLGLPTTTPFLKLIGAKIALAFPSDGLEIGGTITRYLVDAYGMKGQIELTISSTNAIIMIGKDKNERFGLYMIGSREDRGLKFIGIII